jgi:hypothetical protein
MSTAARSCDRAAAVKEHMSESKDTRYAARMAINDRSKKVVISLIVNRRLVETGEANIFDFDSRIILAVGVAEDGTPDATKDELSERLLKHVIDKQAN